MKLATSASARCIAAGALVVAGLLLAGCSAPAGDAAGIEEPAGGSDTATTTPDTSTTDAATPAEGDSTACESALSAAVEMAAAGLGATGVEALDFTLAPSALPADWSAALPASVSGAACPMDLTWGGDTGTIVAFTVTAEELASGMDVTQLQAYQDAVASGGNVNIVAGPDALGMPIDLAMYPDQAKVEPYKLVILQVGG